MTVGLAMIVKNEEETLPRLAASLQDQIDHYTVVDTGSTDNTIDTVKEVFGGVPGEVLQEEWKGYGPARNVAWLAAMNYSEWVMWADADETMEGVIDTEVEGNCIETLEHFATLRYWMPRVTKGPEWQWKNRAHEYLDHPSPMRVRADSFWFVHHADGGNRGDKFQRELELLQADWEDEPTARTAFYLARSYEDVGLHQQAIQWYRTRLSLPGWIEETFYAQYSLGKCLLAIGASDEGCGALWASWGLQSYRAEPLVVLAEHYRLEGLWPLAWHVASLAQDRHEPRNGGLFMDNTLKWRIPYEVSIAAWYTGHKDWGQQMQKTLMGRNDIPEPYWSSVLANQKFYD